MQYTIREQYTTEHKALNHPYRWKELNMLLTDRYNAGVLDNRNTDVKTVRQKLFVVFALDKPVGQRGKGSWSGADRNQKQSGRFVLQSEQQRQYFIYISWVLNHAVTRVVCSAPWLSSRLLSLSTYWSVESQHRGKLRERRSSARKTQLEILNLWPSIKWFEQS